ncbi:MAG: hypothetical protein JEZ06_09485 [Anaerolineaceae bacterium]|nr:hypothetical protein [Anaerolineaceae bacterium]
MHNVSFSNSNKFDPTARIAISGMDIHLGKIEGLTLFKQLLYSGAENYQLSDFSLSKTSSDNNSTKKGNLLQDFEIDLAEMNLSPSDFDELNNEELLLIKVIWSALLDARLDIFEDESPKIAIILDGVKDPGFPNKLQSYWQLETPIVLIDSQENQFPEILKHIQNILQSEANDYVVFASINTFNIELINHTNYPHPHTEGAAAVVFQRMQDPSSEKTAYAAIDMCIQINADSIEDCLSDISKDETTIIFQQFQTQPEEIGLVSTILLDNNSKTCSLPKIFKSKPGNLTTAYFNALNSTGNLFNMNGIVNLIMNTLCLHYRFLPGVSDQENLPKEKIWQDSAFFFPSKSRTWFTDDKVKTRKSNIFLNENNHISITLLSEGCREMKVLAPFSNEKYRLLPISGNSQEDLLSHLINFENKLSEGQNLYNLIAQALDTYLHDPHKTMTLCIIAGNHSEILKEIEFAKNGVPKALQTGQDWQTPLGSFFSPNPLGNEGKIAFVYPGGFNSYIGAGINMLNYFPSFINNLSAISNNLSESAQEKYLYPRSQKALSDSEIQEMENILTAHPVSMLISGTYLSLLYTWLTREILEIEPDMAFGYSLGETSLLYAMGVWKHSDLAREQFSASPLFKERLSGPQNTIRSYWGLNEIGSPDDKILWKNFLLMCKPEKVLERIKDEEKVFLTHINTKRQVVIGGDPEQCLKVISDLKCSSLEAPFNYAIHCDPVKSEFDTLKELHDWSIDFPENTVLYTSAGCQPFVNKQDAVANSIATMLCNRVDFDQLVNRIYGDGARIFIELGASSNCSKWISQILKNENHLSLGINQKGLGDNLSILRMIAKLCSHNVSMNLEKMFSQTKEINEYDFISIKKTVQFTMKTEKMGI